MNLKNENLHGLNSLHGLLSLLSLVSCKISQTIFINLNSENSVNKLNHVNSVNSVNYVNYVIFAFFFLFIFCSEVFAEGPSAWFNFNYTDTRQYEDGSRTESSNSFLQNYYFRLDKSVTPFISYQLYLRSTLNDSHSKDKEGDRTSNYLRAIEPALDIFLQNPLYRFDLGTRRLEQWNSAGLSNDERRTTEFYYSRFNLLPRNLPSFSLQADYQKDYDHLSPKVIDSTNTKYTGSTWYDYNYKSAKFAYNLTYTRDEMKTPASTTTKTINDSFNASYSINFNPSFFRNNFSITAGLQGNYVKNKNQTFAPSGTEIDTLRYAQEGLYASGSDTQPSADTLNPVTGLIDKNYITPASTSSGTINIGLNGNKNQNIGVHLISNIDAVNKIIIYVNKDVRTDTNLQGTITDIEVYRSDANMIGSWSKVEIQPVETDYKRERLNDIYMYKIKFVSPQKALYFKVVTLNTASISDVLITEIEATGTEIVPVTGKLSETITYVSNGISLGTVIKPVRTIILSLNYFLNRTDQEPESFFKATSGAFENLFSKLETELDRKLRINVNRSYGGHLAWQMFRPFTTTLRYQKNESFDNKKESDIMSDTYGLNFSYTPLTTLDANLSFIRTISYTFSEKQSMNDLYLLSIGSKLHRDVNMITDFGYTQTKTYAIINPTSTHTSYTPSEDSTNKVKYIRGTIDARLTNKVSTNLSYGYSRTTGATSSDLMDGSFILTYRPGRFFSISGILKVTDSDGDTNSSEGVMIDWLFLPAIRVNASYQHNFMEEQSRISHAVNSYIIWYITKFLELQLNYSYTYDKEDVKKETYNIGGNLICRFW